MNLTRTAQIFKKSFKIVAIVLGVYYGWVFFGGPGIRSLVKLLYVTKEPPNPVYGKLDPLEFTSVEITNKSPVYRLNTRDGRLPNRLPFKMNVYTFKPHTFSYLAGENATRNARYIGYGNVNLVSDLKSNIYKWRRLDTSSYLEIDIASGRLTGEADIVKNATFIQKGKISKDSASKQAIAFFTELERMDELYENGEQKVQLAYIGGTKILPTNTLKEVQLARVDLYRKIGDFLILGPDPKVGLLNVYYAVTTASRSNAIILGYPRINAYYRELEAETTASYPIIDISVAWNAIKDGKGVITNVTPAGTSSLDQFQPQNVEEILIDNIYLAYYENDKDQKYLQPIYVFEGKYRSMGSGGGEITLYLPAVSGEYVKSIEKPAENTTK